MKRDDLTRQVVTDTPSTHSQCEASGSSELIPQSEQSS